MNVLVIPENFRNDQYILRPLFRRLFASIGKRHATVEICSDPPVQGVDEALRSECIREIIDQHRGMVHLFILCVDRDGIQGRQARLNQIEAEFGVGRRFLTENAWEEVEVWTLAGLNLPRDWKWREIREAVDVKERYFDALARARNVADGPGHGRQVLGEEAARNVRTIRQKCPEDFDRLARRIEDATRNA